MKSAFDSSRPDVSEWVAPIDPGPFLELKTAEMLEEDRKSRCLICEQESQKKG
jgi:hypothetical protein